jgi:SAM-dependent methyltransferase
MPIDYNAVAEQYAEHRRIHPDVLTQLVAALRRYDDAAVLEVGCGTGNYIISIRDAVGCRCTALEPSKAMAAAFLARNSGVPLLEGRAEDLPLPADELDLVFSVDVIHHVVDHRRAIAEAFRVLRDGGRFCIVTDSEWVIRNRVPLSVYFPETVEIELARYPRVHALATMMDAIGFTALAETLAETAHDLVDAAPYRDKAFSSLQLLEARPFQRGLDRLEAALRHGPIRCMSRYTLLWGTKRVGAY